MEDGMQQRLDLQHLMVRVAIHRARALRRRQVAPLGPHPAPIHPLGQARLARARCPNIPRVRLTPLGLTAQQVMTTYRFDMGSILAILDEIHDDIGADIRINTAIPPILKLLSVLHFCATGSFQHTTGMLHGIAQPTFSVILTQVLAAIRRRVQHHIYMPRTPAEINAAKAAFYAIAGFPYVVGCTDCTHIGMVPPRDQEQAYRNRKMTHSMNVQMTCDASLCIQELCARFPGSAHDARILRASALFALMEQHMPPRTVLLGESTLAVCNMVRGTSQHTPPTLSHHSTMWSHPCRAIACKGSTRPTIHPHHLHDSTQPPTPHTPMGTATTGEQTVRPLARLVTTSYLPPQVTVAILCCPG